MLNGFKIKKSDSLDGNDIYVAVGISQGSKTINRPTTFVNGTQVSFTKKSKIKIISEPPLTD
jgi:hypothetical protein